MSNFKNNVLFYLRGLSEENEDKKVCPKCGKYPCVCDKNSSASTKTAGGDDGDDYTKNASTDSEDQKEMENFEKRTGQKVSSMIRGKNGEPFFIPNEDSKKKSSTSTDKDAYFGTKVPADGYTEEEKAILKNIANKIKKNSELKEPADGWTPEEKEIIKLLSKKSAVVDDHTNGANGCADTEASKKTEACPKCGKNPCVCDKNEDKKSSLKESILDLLR